MIVQWLLRRLATRRIRVGPHELHVHREDGHLWAEAQGIPGCFASATTMAELRDAAYEAVDMCLESVHGPVAKWGDRWAKTNQAPW